MTAINKYNKSMIYTIRSPHTEQYYIGSTTQILCKRFSDHNIDYKAYLKGKGNFITSFKILELGDAYIELLEEINCDNRNQLDKREGELIREHKNNCVNKYIAGRTQKEYKTDNPEQLKQTYKKYRINNKELLSDKKQQYYRDNIESIKAKAKLPYLCACGSTIRTCDKVRHNKSAKHIKALELEIIIV